MADVNYERRKMYVATEASPGTDPSADGSTIYAPVKAVRDGISDIETIVENSGENYATGRNRATEKEVLRTLSKVTVQAEITPFAADVDDGASPPATEDALDMLLGSAFGPPIDYAGEGLLAGAVGLATLDSDLYTEGEALVIWESGVNSSRAMVRLIADETAPAAYVPNRNFTAGITAGAVAQGYRSWQAENLVGDGEATGRTLSAYVVEDTDPYTLNLGRAKATTLTHEHGKKTKIGFELMFRDRSQVAKASIPVISPGTIIAGTQAPIQGELSEIDFGGTVYGKVAKIEIQFGSDQTIYGGLDGAQGIADFANTAFMPLVTVTFPASATWLTAADAGTLGELVIRIGSGARATTLPMWLFAAFQTQVISRKRVNDSGISRNEVVFEVQDAGLTGGTTSVLAPYWILGRC